MPKLTIVISAVLFALISATNADVWTNPVRVVRQRAEKTITAAMIQHEKNFIAMLRKNDEIAKNASHKAIRLRKKVTNEISLVNLKINSEIQNFTDKAANVNISVCIRNFNTLKNITDDVLSNFPVCIADNFRIGFNYMKNITKLFKYELGRLIAIQVETQNCNQDIDNINSAVAYMLCVKRASDKTKWVSPEFEQDLANYTTSLNLSLANFEDSFYSCMNANGLAYFNQATLSILEKTEKCIQRKIDEATPSEFITPIEKQWMPIIELLTYYIFNETPIVVIL